MTGCALTPVGVATTVAPTVAKAILLPERNRVVKITGTGNTEEEAKQDGFNKAVEQYVGVVVVTAREISNDKLTRDDVIHHSAGYVEQYKIVSTEHTGKRVTVYMEVTIRESKIAERILSKNNATENVGGGQLAAQYDTYMKSRQTGDQLMGYLLSNYPESAYNITADKTRFVVDAQRNALVEIPFQIDWNYHYLQALREGMSQVSDRKSFNHIQSHLVMSAKPPGGWMPWHEDYVFDDAVRYEKIKYVLNIPMSVFAEFHDAAGNIIQSTCYRTYYPRGLIVQGENRIINGEIAQVQDVVRITTTENGKTRAFLKNTDRIDLVVRRGSCRMYEQLEKYGP